VRRDIHPRIVVGNRFLLLIVLAAGTAFPHVACGGGSPLNTLVVVNTRSRRSVKIGEYYCHKRGIPLINLVRLRVPVGSDISLERFERLIRQPILRYIRRHRLENQIGYLVFCGDFPYRVCRDRKKNNCNSITSIMFYGYRDSPPPCSLPRDTASTYFRAGWDFLQWRRRFKTPRFIATLLTGWKEGQVRRLIDRSVQADGGLPTGIVYLVHTPDFNRNKRWVAYEEAARFVEFAGSPVRVVITSAWEVAHVDHVIGYMLGRFAPKKTDTIDFLAGALADHFTSWGGYLYDSSWQMSVLDWISNGCVGSCGTVVEPCSYRQKFAEPQLFDWYARGYTMGESYFLSIANPYQTLVVGDPLCAPYAVRAHGVARIHRQEGRKTLQYRVWSGHKHHPLARVDLYVDGRWYGVVTNIVPEPGNRVIVEIAGITNIYVVRQNDRLPDILKGLAVIIRHNVDDTIVEVRGDRLILIRTAPLSGHQPVHYRAYTDPGQAKRLTVHAWPAYGYFKEGSYRARRLVFLKGKPEPGDSLELVVRTPKGIVVTCMVSAVSSSSIMDLVADLRTTIERHPILAGPWGIAIENVEKAGKDNVVFSFVARTPGPQGILTLVDLRVRRKNPGGSSLTGGGVDYLRWNARSLMGWGEVRLARGLYELEGELELSDYDCPKDSRAVLVAADGTGAAIASWFECSQDD